MARMFAAAGGMIAALVIGPGCRWSGDPSGARFRCDGPSACPGGLACIDGYCEAGDPGERADAAGGGDAGEVDVGHLAWQDHAVGFREATLFETVVTAAELSGDPGDLYLAFLSTKPRRVDGVASGLGLRWTRAREQCSGRNTAGLTMFWARSADAARGRVTVSFAADSFPGSALLSVHRYSGSSAATPIGNLSWANSNGSDQETLECIGGDDSTSYSWSALDTGAEGSVVVSGAHTTRYTSHEPGDGYTERADDQSGDLSTSAGVAVQERRFADVVTDLTVSGGWDEAPDWAVIAAELRD